MLRLENVSERKGTEFLNEGNGRIKKPEELLNEHLLMQIPTDPQKEEIIEILAKNPAVISYIQNILVETKNKISMKKLLIKKAEKEFERKQSQIRLDTTRNYQKRLTEALQREPKRQEELMEAGLSKVEAREHVKLERPDKPTATDLKDTSIVLGKMFYEENILPLEEDIQGLENYYDSWKVKYNLFENNFKASQSIKGLIQLDASNH